MPADAKDLVILIPTFGDDDDDLADVVRQVLRDAGYSVATVRHGAAALELTKHVAPDLILVDLSMPIMDGWSFVWQYRRMARQGARIVLLTGNPSAARAIGTIIIAIAAVRKSLCLKRCIPDPSSACR